MKDWEGDDVIIFNFQRLKILFQYSVCMYMHMRRPKGVRFPGMEQQGVVSHLMWVLGIEHGSSERALNCLAIAPAPKLL